MSWTGGQGQIILSPLRVVMALLYTKPRLCSFYVGKCDLQQTSSSVDLHGPPETLFECKESTNVLFGLADFVICSVCY